MADVLIVCVREDEPQAKALAEMFEAAGFSIGGAPSSDGALRSSGAGVVVWSQASIRSRPFLDAAQRVINAGKAVVASLIEPPPASSIGSSPAFDLSQWDGDPNDPSLDPLFFAVDRMVNAARTAVGATAPIADPQSYEAAPVTRAPRQASTSQPTYRAPSTDEDLTSETEYWRAIRDSRNASDFMDYLARFGPDGAFAEVAELRLKQLTDTGQGRTARTATPRSVAAMPSSRPRPEIQARSETTSRREPSAAARRPEAAPPQRRAHIYDRHYDRPSDLSEPPRGQGGALRIFVLVALLGAALAGGLYFGGGLEGLGGAPRQAQSDQLDFAAAPTVSPEEPASYEPERFSIAEPADARPTPPAPRRQVQRAPTPPVRVVEDDAPTPAPVMSWTSSGGPISLSPGAQAPNPSGVAAAPIELGPVQLASVEPSLQSALPPTEAPAVRAQTVLWAQRPSARRIAELYPQRAIRQGVGGRVQLDCTVQANLSVACGIASETPIGMGFGRAALSASSSYRAQPTLGDGASAVGARARIAMNFQAPQ